jgi:predicted esterase
MTAGGLSFVHVYERGADPHARTLLLLHGTGGNEHDLLQLGPMLLPGANLLSPRGQVLEDGRPRFFRRFAEGLLDLEDLERRAGELGDFVVAAAAHYGFDSARVVAVGFSNGANIASGLLLIHPGLLSGAVLLRAMVTLVPDPLPALSARVLISNGQSDPLVSAEETERLASILRRCGARVDLVWQPAGHQLTQNDVNAAHRWLLQTVTANL